MTDDKIDFKKTLDRYRAVRGRFRLLDVPETQYLMIDGHGDPNTSLEYASALEALYPIAYKLKFLSKRELGRDYVVPPPEGLWWADDYAAFTTARDKSQWDWTMMLMVPEWLGPEHVSRAVDQAGTASRAQAAPPARLDEVRLESLDEGRCVQTLHVGSFDDEAPVLAEMHERFIPDHGFGLAGKHHEIYLSDPRRTAPERLRTLLRQPVLPAST
jgi:hypothetical protein